MGNSKEYNWGIVEKAWRIGTWIDLSVDVQSLKIFVPPVNTRQRVTYIEKNIHNQVDKMTHPVDISHPLSPVPTVLAQ